MPSLNYLLNYLLNHFILRLLSFSLVVLSPSVSFSNVIEQTAYIDFFLTADQKPMVGLSCSSEKECQSLCAGTDSCQKPVSTCLNCVGSKSPYLDDFFNNMGELTTSCFDQGVLTQESEAIFGSVSMIPMTPSSAYNPLGLKDLSQTLKFMSLCPAGTLEPVAVAFTDSFTNAILEIPLIKCGKTLYPLVRINEDCVKKTAQIYEFIKQSSESKKHIRANRDAALKLADQLPLKYDVLQYSKFFESQYLRCNSTSKAVCQSICNSSLSCTAPLNNLRTANAILTFNKVKWTGCGIDRFSPEVLLDYLKSSDTISFSYDSLSQSYDLPLDTGGFKDFSVINLILSEFSGVFSSQNTAQSIDGDSSNSSFFVSEAYRYKLKIQMKLLCDNDTDPVILGHNGKIERVFCRSDVNGYFRVLISENESCESKIKAIASRSQTKGGTP